MKKVLSMVIIVSMIFSLVPSVFANSAGDMIDSGMDYTESTQMLKNPHMGYPSIVGYTLSEVGTPIRNDSGFVWYYVNLSNFSAGNDLYYRTYDESKTEPFAGTDKPISDSALNAFSQTLNNLRLNGGSTFMRFVYDWDGVVGCEPSDFQMILTHIRQLCEVVSEYEDVVLGFECGIVGVFGEMHSSEYTGKEYTNPIIDAYLDNTPESMILMLRTPGYIANYLEVNRETLPNITTEKGSKEYRLGLYNDGYMNSGSDLGTWMDRTKEIKFLESQSEHTTYGGEYGSAYQAEYLPNSACIPENAIPEMYRTHVSYIRGNVYKIGGNNNVFGYDQYEYSPLYEEEWFPDNSAFYNSDCHTFITSHLGYRLVLRESQLSASAYTGGTLRLRGSIENTGFANILHSPKAQVLLVKEGVVYICDVDLDAFDMKSCTVYDYDFTLSLPASMVGGDYQVYLRLAGSDESFYASAKSGIQFANNGGIYNPQLGANKLGIVTITKSEIAASAANDVFAQMGETKAGAKATVGAPKLLGYDFDVTGSMPLTFNAGDDVTLTILDFLHPNNEVTYQWLKNGELISGGKDLTIHDIAPSDAGIYSRIVTANGNSYSTISVEVTVTTNAFSDYNTTIEPTCSSTGEAVRICGDLTETKILPALSHVVGSPITIPSSCSERGRIITPCSLCGETISYKLLPLEPHDFVGTVTTSPTCTQEGEMLYSCSSCDEQETASLNALGHSFDYTINENVVSGICSMCEETMGPKVYDGVSNGHDIISKEPVKFEKDTIVMVGEGGFTPSYQTKKATEELTFLFKVTGVETPITFAKFRTLTYTKDLPGNIVDSNNAPNYYGEGAYKVTEDGVWALSMTRVVMNFTGNQGFGGITRAAFYDPQSTKGTANPLNNNENSSFELLGIYDGTLSYDIIFVDDNGSFLERHSGDYNKDVKWTNLITKVGDVDYLYQGELPGKPSDNDWVYTFEEWVDAEGKPLNMAIGNVIAYPSFSAMPKLDAHSVAETKALLTWDSIKGTNTEQDNITDNLNLPTFGAEGCTISWTSSDPSIISEIGDVNRPTSNEGNKTVVLTATITKGSERDTAIFTLKVIALPEKGGGGTGGGGNGGGKTPEKEDDSLPEDPISPSPIEEYVNPYKDVAKQDWHYEAVKFVTVKGLMKGVYSDEFAPNTNITRAMLVTILYRDAGEPIVEGDSIFGDVTAGQWYTNAVAWGGSRGIIEGYYDGNFGPNDVVTREQIVTILYRYAKSKGLDVSVEFELINYADMTQISDWALPAIKWAVAEGMLKGYTDTTIAPNNIATRAEVAAILNRFLGEFSDFNGTDNEANEGAQLAMGNS